MKNSILLIAVLFICFVCLSCSPTQVSEVNGELPKEEIDSANSIKHMNAKPEPSQPKMLETNIYFNEIAKKLPKLYENLIPKLRRLGYSKILLKRYPQFSFRIEHAGTEWIVKSIMKRRKYLLDTIGLMINLEFVKFFQKENVQIMFSGDAKDAASTGNSEENTEIADAMLVIDGKLDVRPLAPLSVTGMEYLLRLKYQVQAYLIDLKTGSKTWFGETQWRRNLLATTMD
ncbi:MAG: hypothetical protein K8S87_09430 [Planctomycetes bacterium]|nr:hypothetical protein [Planctomycetota bacterium]